MAPQIPSAAKLRAENRRLIRQIQSMAGKQSGIMKGFTDAVSGVSELLKELAEIPDQFTKSLKA